MMIVVTMMVGSNSCLSWGSRSGSRRSTNCPCAIDADSMRTQRRQINNPCTRRCVWRRVTSTNSPPSGRWWYIHYYIHRQSTRIDRASVVNCTGSTWRSTHREIVVGFQTNQTILNSNSITHECNASARIYVIDNDMGISIHGLSSDRRVCDDPYHSAEGMVLSWTRRRGGRRSPTDGRDGIHLDIAIVLGLRLRARSVSVRTRGRRRRWSRSMRSTVSGSSCRRTRTVPHWTSNDCPASFTTWNDN